MNKLLAAQRFELTYKAVHLQCLDKDGVPIAGTDASGFIRREDNALYLYTCWHVVTGQGLHDSMPASVPSSRAALVVTLHDAQQPHGADIGGSPRHLLLPLLDASGKPLWCQDRKDDPQAEIHASSFRVPFYHDAVKLRLPDDAGISSIQVSEEACFLKDHTAMPGDKVLLAGYPLGYTGFRPGPAAPVILTRFIAATRIPGDKRELLLDGAGAPGMAGGPVFIEHGTSIYLLGLYTGPLDQAGGKGEASAALSSCCDLTLCWKRMPLQPYAS